MIDTILDTFRANKRMAIIMELFTYPFPILVKKIGKAIRKRILPQSPIYYEDNRYTPRPNIQEHYLSIKAIDTKSINPEIASLLIQNYKEHRFDLLGSGPVSVNYGSIPLGLEGSFYLLDESIEEKIKEHKIETLLPPQFQENTKKLLQLLPVSYKTIDWHRDFKSGFRFDSSKNHDQTLYQIPMGVDLKCPWELTRLQHLPTMAILAKYAPEEQTALISEFRNQIIDHIALNPAGIGVNWACAMDVGIRISNILIAYDLFSELDTKHILDKDFQQLVATYAYDHGVFLYHNLEYGDGITSNHYLSNIAGLIFIGAYLEPTPMVLDWLYFGIQELEVETKKQFFEEGTNFEGSTSYHRLSTEILLYCAAVLEGMSPERKKLVRNHKPSPRQQAPAINSALFHSTQNAILSNAFYHRLFHAIKFTNDLLKNNDEIPQYGDNDSGRFVKIFPIGKVITTSEAINTYENLRGIHEIYPYPNYFDENILNHAHLVTAGNALFKNNTLNKYDHTYPIDHAIISSFIKNFKPPIVLNDPHDFIQQIEFAKLPFHLQKFFPSKTTHSFLEGMTVSHYPAFGITIFKSNFLYFSIGYGTNRKSHRSWGHQHNDKLSIELRIENEDVLIQNGTYLYTPMPELRNKFRSTFQKNVAYIIGEEQNWWKQTKPGLFSLIKQTKSKVLLLSPQEIMVQLTYRNYTQIRHVRIKKHEVEVYDYCDFPITQHWNDQSMISNGYGKLKMMKK